QAEPASWAKYGERDVTRREHAQELRTYLQLAPFGLSDFRALVFFTLFSSPRRGLFDICLLLLFLKKNYFYFILFLILFFVFFFLNHRRPTKITLIFLFAGVEFY
ncbi:DUF4158 domain-containing protein, partial [Enterobacter hormaechei]